MKEAYLDARVEFEKDLYTHDGALYFNYDETRKIFYHGIVKNAHTILTGYGPNPMGLVDEKTTTSGDITFTDEVIRFCVSSEILSGPLKQLLEIGMDDRKQAA